MTRILFICSRNSCRSQMAEGFALAQNAEDVEIASAGTEASEVNKTAIQVMSEAGVDITGQRSKSLDDLDSLDFDIVISLCHQAAESCPILPGNPAQVNWNLDDPAEAEGDAEKVLDRFKEIRDQISHLVDDLFHRGYLQALAPARHVK